MRRMMAAGVTIALFAVGFSTARAESSERVDVDFRYVTTVHDVTHSYLSRNGEWFYARTELENVGQGTFGDDAYLSRASGTALSRTSNADDPALPPGSGDDGWINIRAAATFDPVDGGPRISCKGWIFLERYEADYPFPSNSRGVFGWWCDNGWWVTGTADARWELDPAAGAPVYVVYYDGVAR